MVNNKKSASSKKSAPNRAAARSTTRTITAPAAVGNKTVAGRQEVRMSRDTANVVNTEYVVGVYNNPTMLVREYAVNPGLYIQQGGCFTWLNYVANRYETYRIKRLKFRYAPTCSSTTTGQIGMYLDYGVTDPRPTSWSLASSNKGFVSGSPWAPLELVLDPSAVTPARKFNRSDLTNGTDLRLADAARLHVITNGGADNANIGYLYVDYEVELRTPEMNDIYGTASLSSIGGTVQAKSTTLTSTVEKAIDFNDYLTAEGLGGHTIHSDFIDLTGTNGRILLARGNWIVRAQVFLANAAAATTALAIALKRYTPANTRDHTAVNTALDSTGSGAHETLPGHRGSIHSTADTSVGDIPINSEWTLYSDGDSYYGVYATSVFTGGPVSVTTATRLTVQPLK